MILANLSSHTFGLTQHLGSRRAQRCREIGGELSLQHGGSVGGASSKRIFPGGTRETQPWR